MNRLLFAALVGLALANPASADIAPPKGLKRVVLDTRITTEKEFPDHAFFLVSGGDKVEAVKLDPKNPIVIAGEGRGGRYQLVTLHAVPKDAAKKYGTEKAFHEAIVAGKVAGQLKARDGFPTLATLKDADARKTVTEEYKLEKIDLKDGLVVTHTKAGEKKGPTSASPGDGKPEEAEGVTAYTPKAGVWVAALAATAGLVFGGLWLAGRRRREGA